MDLSSGITLTSLTWTAYIKFAVTIFAMLNPFGNASVYLTLVSDHSMAEKKHVARKTCISIFIILVTIVWTGAAILNFFGLNIGAFRVGGGLIVIIIGLQLLGYMKIDHKYGGKKADTKKHSIATVPLAIPIIAGPGAIAATMTEVHNSFQTFTEKINITVIVAIVTFLIWLILHFAPNVGRFIGEQGLEIIKKLWVSS